MSAGQNERGPRVGMRLPILCGSAVVACAAWALTPLRGLGAPDAATAAAVETPGPSPTPSKADLDLAAFRVPVWTVPPPPAPPPQPAPPPPPPPPLKLQLLAIVREGGTLKASVYDSDADAIALVGEGDAVGSRTVERVTAESVTIRDGGREHTLALERAGPPAGGGGRR